MICGSAASRMSSLLYLPPLLREGPGALHGTEKERCSFHSSSAPTRRRSTCTCAGAPSVKRRRRAILCPCLADGISEAMLNAVWKGGKRAACCIEVESWSWPKRLGHVGPTPRRLHDGGQLASFFSFHNLIQAKSKVLQLSWMCEQAGLLANERRERIKSPTLTQRLVRCLGVRPHALGPQSTSSAL